MQNVAGIARVRPKKGNTSPLFGRSGFSQDERKILS